MKDSCVLCGTVDDDTELGWTICHDCFRPGGYPVQDWPSPWVTVARVISVLLFVFSVIVLAAALGQLSR